MTARESERLVRGPRDSACVDDAVDAIDDRAETIRERQLRQALAALDDRGDLTADKRRAVESLADRLTARLLTPPKVGLRQAAASGDDDVADTALSLFGADREE